MCRGGYDIFALRCQILQLSDLEKMHRPLFMTLNVHVDSEPLKSLHFAHRYRLLLVSSIARKEISSKYGLI